MAEVVELIHTATLLHDDVIDKSLLRRGEHTANRVWGDKACVLVGDFLLARAFRLMTEDGDLKILNTLSRASEEIIEGEILQLSAGRDPASAFDEYFTIITAKTARLFAAACSVGALVAGDNEKAALLAEYGLNLGILFQMVDDALDYFAPQSTYGKKAGNDFSEGKVTLPVILAYKQASRDERRFWDQHFNTDDNGSNGGDEKFQQALEIMTRHGIREQTLAEAAKYAKKALGSLEGLPENPYLHALNEAVTYCLNRQS